MFIFILEHLTYSTGLVVSFVLMTLYVISFQRNYREYTLDDIGVYVVGVLLSWLTVFLICLILLALSSEYFGNVKPFKKRK